MVKARRVTGYGLCYVEFAEPVRNELYPATIPYAMKKSREDGEKDLAKIAMHERNEGSFLFSHDTSTWCSISVGHASGKHDMSVSSYTMHMEDIGSHVTQYHTHPLEFHVAEFIRLARVMFRKLHRRPSESEIKSFFNYCNERLGADFFMDENIMPSEDDIKSYVRMMQHRGSSELDFKIVSPYGITSIAIDKDMAEMYMYDMQLELLDEQLDRLDRLDGRCTRSRSRGKKLFDLDKIYKMASDYFSSHKDEFEKIEDKIKKVIEIANDVYPNMHFSIKIYAGLDRNRLLESTCDRLIEYYKNDYKPSTWDNICRIFGFSKYKPEPSMVA